MPRPAPVCGGRTARSRHARPGVGRRADEAPGTPPALTAAGCAAGSCRRGRTPLREPGLPGLPLPLPLPRRAARRQHPPARAAPKPGARRAAASRAARAVGVRSSCTRRFRRRRSPGARAAGCAALQRVRRWTSARARRAAAGHRTRGCDLGRRPAGQAQAVADPAVGGSGRSAAALSARAPFAGQCTASLRRGRVRGPSTGAARGPLVPALAAARLSASASKRRRRRAAIAARRLRRSRPPVPQASAARDFGLIPMRKPRLGVGKRQSLYRIPAPRVRIGRSGRSAATGPKRPAPLQATTATVAPAAGRGRPQGRAGPACGARPSGFARTRGADTTPRYAL